VTADATLICWPCRLDCWDRQRGAGLSGLIVPGQRRPATIKSETIFLLYRLSEQVPETARNFAQSRLSVGAEELSLKVATFRGRSITVAEPGNSDIVDAGEGWDEFHAARYAAEVSKIPIAGTKTGP
jgi:hypothetical protein